MSLFKKEMHRKRWREFEERVIEKSRIYNGYDVRSHQTSRRTGRTPDIFAVNPHDSRDRIVGEVKWVDEVLPRHVDQVAREKRDFFAPRGVLHIPRDATVPDTVRERARDKNVELIRSRKKKHWF